MRRAMRWQYCPPALRTTIWFTGGAALAWTPQLLRLLEDLAFGLDGGRDDQLGLLQLADRLGPHRAHAGADGPDEVQRAVLREGRPKRICSSEPAMPTRMRVPRGRFACGVAMPQ